MRSLFVLALGVAAVAAFVVVKPEVITSNDSIIECEMCEIAVRVAAPTLGKDAQAVENDFIKECEKIITGKAGQLACPAYAQKELGNIIKELESGTAPKDVCTKEHAC